LTWDAQADFFLITRLENARTNNTFLLQDKKHFNKTKERMPYSEHTDLWTTLLPQHGVSNEVATYAPV